VAAAAIFEKTREVGSSIEPEVSRTATSWPAGRPCAGHRDDVGPLPGVLCDSARSSRRAKPGSLGSREQRHRALEHHGPVRRRLDGGANHLVDPRRDVAPGLAARGALLLQGGGEAHFPGKSACLLVGLRRERGAGGSAGPLPSGDAAASPPSLFAATPARDSGGSSSARARPRDPPVITRAAPSGRS
jgi:hypothetical protein